MNQNGQLRPVRKQGGGCNTTVTLSEFHQRYMPPNLIHLMTTCCHLFYFFETGLHYVLQAGLEPTILLPGTMYYHARFAVSLFGSFFFFFNSRTTKKKRPAWHQQLKSVSLATWEAEIKRIMV
jgi:hypothetical protein